MVAEVKPFLERYMAIEEWKQEMRLVIKALVKVNHQIALEYGIRSLLSTSPVRTVCVCVCRKKPDLPHTQRH